MLCYSMKTSTITSLLINDKHKKVKNQIVRQQVKMQKSNPKLLAYHSPYKKIP